MREPGRRFTLLDAMILVAAMALGTAALRARLPGPVEMDFSFGVNPVWLWTYREFHRVWFYVNPYLAFLTPACVVLARPGPRGRLRRVLGRPGVAACSVASLALAFDLAADLSDRALAWPKTQPDRYWEGFGNETGFYVAGCWLTLALTRRWRPGGSWVDRLGLAVGVAWLGATFGRYWLSAFMYL